MRRSVAITVLVSLVWVCCANLAGAQDEEVIPEPEEPRVVSYATKEYGIYFDVPAGWVVNKKPASGLVEVTSGLGYATVNVAVKILKDRVDVLDFVKEQESILGWHGEFAVDVLEAGALSPDEKGVLDDFLLDDRKAMEKKREKWEKEQAEKAVKAGMDDVQFSSLTEERPLFHARMTTKLYDFPDKGTKYLVYYVIGGGIGYRITVSAERDGFYSKLPLSRVIIDGINPPGLKGGRYAMPSETQMRATKQGLILGKVLSNGSPVAGVNVKLYETNASYERGDAVCEARSNHYGEYVLTSLRPGKYYLLEAVGTTDDGTRVRSLQPITNINVESANAVYINVEVVTK